LIACCIIETISFEPSGLAKIASAFLLDGGGVPKVECPIRQPLVWADVRAGIGRGIG
jgi:hypothetical protein